MELQGALGARTKFATRFWDARFWLPALLLCAAWLWSSSASAAPSAFCPTLSISVAHNGVAELDVSTCDGPDNFVIGPVRPPGPQHGTAAITVEDGTLRELLTYTHNGDSATTDTFVVDDSTGGDITVTVTIAPASTYVVTSTLNAMTVGVPFSQQLEATGGVGASTWSIATPPPGLSLSSSGLLSGTPTQRGPHLFSVTATDTASATANKSFNPTIANPNLTLSPTSPPNAAVGMPYTVSFTAANGVAPYSFLHEVASGALPPGLVLSGNTLSGTPTTTGTYTFGIRVTDTSTGPGTWFEVETVTLTVALAPTIVVDPASLADATIGVAYSDTFTGSGGTDPYTFAVSAGALPAGLLLNGTTGALTGTPTAGGTFNFTVRATDANSFTGTRAYTMTVAAPTITIAPATLPNATVAAAYSQTITASGGTAGYSYAITAGALPAGVTLSSGGTLSGTPTAGGTFNFTVTATDSSTGSGPYTGSRAYSLVVAAPTVVLPATTLANGTVGVAYSATLNPASGGTSPYTYAVTAGALPAGISLSSAGALSGTPSAAGTFNFAVTATDSSTGAGPYSSAPRGYSLQVVQIPPVANPVSASVAYGSGANPITLNITGGTPTSVAVAAAPAHGTAIASGVSITYQPAAGYAGPDSFTYTATNAAGTSAPATVTITVANPVITVTASAPLTAQVGVPYSQTFTWSGGAPPYSGYSVAGLPAGLAITGTTSDSVTVSGTPTASGSFSLNASATDSSTGNGPFGQGQIFTLAVGAPTLTMTPAAGTLPLTYGAPNTVNFAASGGTGPYAFSLNAGALPVGVSFSSAGVLSGTPTVPGSYSISVRVDDSSTGAGAPFALIQNYVLQVGAPAIVISPATMPNGAVGTPYSTTLTASGGIGPYSFSLLAGALPIGMSFSSAGVFSGIPRSDGNFSLTVQATDANGQNASQVYTFTIAPPVLVIDPATLPNGTAGVPYSATLTASGGIAPYSFSIVSGALPIGVSFSSAGVFGGTPTTAGTFNTTIRATDDAGYNVTQAYTIVIAAPVITISPATLPGGVVGVPYNQTLSSSGGVAPYAYSIVSGNLPIGVSFSSAGVFGGTPTTVGSYTANIRSTDSNGFDTTVAYTIVIADAVPVAVADTATTLAGTAATIPVTTNDTGVISSIAVASTPAHGTAVVSGLGVLYTPAAGYSGTDTFTYTATGPGGTSAPATVTVTVNPVPIAVSSHVETTAGAAVHVNLTAGASGGPFTAATLVSLSPASSGTATIAGSGGAYELTFVPAVGFSGLATVTFTLSNAYAVSAPATVEILVAGRSDPSKDAEVLGLLGAQASAARRFANSQINNFQQRLESMHGGGEGRAGFQNGITFSAERRCNPSTRYARGGEECPQTMLRDEDAPVAAPAPMQGESAAQQAPFAVWTGGSINRGDRDAQTGVSGFDFETAGISAGADFRLNPSFALGGGVGYGRDDTDIGRSGSRSEADSYTVAMYASYHPGERFYLDGLVGYQWMSFDNRRFVTDNGNLVTGERDGTQWFASLSTGIDYRQDRLQVSPYARLDVARATLDRYTERGDAIYALDYRKQDVDTTTTSLGVRLDYRNDVSWGTFSPQFRLEYQHDFQDDGSATMGYADLPAGPLYRALLQGLDRNRIMFGIGAALRTEHDLTFRFEYRGLLGSDGDSDHGILLNLEKKY